MAMQVPPLIDLLQQAREYNQVWPADLVDDLEEEDPHISFFSQLYSTLISNSKSSKQSPQNNETQKRKSSTLPSLVVPGWNNTKIKGTKNWSDFENLLLFYTIGKLTVADTLQEQKEADKNELRQVIEDFLPLKGQKRKSAEKRVEVNTTYLAFGKRMIKGLLAKNPFTLQDLQREIEDAEENNSFNAKKLEKSRSIATRVVKRLKERYHC